MDIFSDFKARKILQEIYEALKEDNYVQAAKNSATLFETSYQKIPDNKRISYGEVYIIKELSKIIYQLLEENSIDAFIVGKHFFNLENDYHLQGIGLNILSLIGIEKPKKVRIFFEQAACSPNWHLREYAQMFFRKLIKNHSAEMHSFLLEKVESNSPFVRRFVAETLRPVQENRWLFKDINYSLSILKFLFKESHPYPRTSVGNNLSDISKKLPEKIFAIVADLVSLEDENSYWIAYRACRNLVKIYPDRVLDVLGINSYKYKSKIYPRKND